MAKGIRSKIKRFWRTKWRKEIGAPVADARAAKAAEIMARSMALQAGASSASRLANCGRGVRGSAVQARAGMPSCVVDAPCLFGLCLRCCPCATGTTFRPISWATCLSTCRPCSLRLHLLYCVDTQPAMLLVPTSRMRQGLLAGPLWSGLTHRSTRCVA